MFKVKECGVLMCGSRRVLGVLVGGIGYSRGVVRGGVEGLECGG